MDENEIAEFMIECVIENRIGLCDYCKQESIYVRLQDTTYRNMGAKHPCWSPLCIECYINYIVKPMDELWDDYNAGRL